MLRSVNELEGWFTLGGRLVQGGLSVMPGSRWVELHGWFTVGSMLGYVSTLSTVRQTL